MDGGLLPPRLHRQIGGNGKPLRRTRCLVVAPQSTCLLLPEPIHRSPFESHSPAMLLEAEREYRALIALNNIGISLLARGEWEKAFSTLQDAAMLLRLVFHAVATPSGDAHSTIDLDAALQRANHRHASYEPTCTTASSFLPSIQVSVISCRAERSDIELVLRENPLKDRLVHPIRLEMHDHEMVYNADREKEATLTCLSILHNCTVASICSLQSCPPCNVSQLQLKSFRMLSLCQQMVSSNLHCGGGSRSYLQLRQHMFIY